MTAWLPLAVLGLGVLLFAVAGRALAARQRERTHGRLVSVDRPGRGAPLSSDRWGLVGRPDELRQLPDGRFVPVELKRRSTPPNGPPSSHRIQVAAYCLLLEETTGARPPYGVLRYGDGGEYRIAWDAAARSELSRLRAQVARPYDGRATPSPGKCRRCRWREGCDARAA